MQEDQRRAALHAQELREVESQLAAMNLQKQQEEATLRAQWQERDRQLWARIDAVIKKEEDKLRAKQEEERKKREEEERVKREAEEKKRQEEERKRKEDEDKRKEKEREEAKKKEEEEKKEKKEKETAKVEGAVQIAIGVKKEVDFAGWYTNVSILKNKNVFLKPHAALGASQSRYVRLL